MGTIIFGGQFIASKAPKTGLADVTIRITRVTLADLTLYALVTDAACAEDTASAKGGYLYRLANANCATYAYIAYMSTADATVDQKCVAAMGEIVQADLISILGAAITGTAAQIVAAFVKFFDVVTARFTAGSYDQTGDSYSIVSHADYGNAQLVRSTTPANTLSVDAAHKVPATLATGDVTGNLPAAVNSMADNTLTASALATDAGAEIADAVAARVYEGTLTQEQIMRILLAAAAGLVNDAETGAPKFRDVADSKNRIAATVDEDGNRLTITLDGT
jgi:hypothetical protein